MSKYRIMIVDDDEDARRMLSLALAARYETVEACDGLDALSKLELYEPDFAIIDIMMPLMDGYQLCEAIRRHPSYKYMQVIFLSAFGTNENVKKSYAVGANLFMTKPVDPERVLRNIDFTIEHEPPPMHHKKHTLEDLARIEREQKVAAAAPPPPPPPPDPRRPASPTPATAESFVQAPRLEEPYSRPGSAAPSDHTLPSEERYEEESLAHTRGGLPRALVVDDDEEMLKMVDLALREDFEITTATNGLEAIERMVDYEPDLVLLDIMMPKMNGYQLLQSIRQNSFLRNLPVVVLSAKSTPKDREYAAKLGATNFMAKPYSVDELIDLLKGITRERNFHMRPKKLSIFEIKDQEYRDHRERSKRQSERQRKEKYAEMEKVIEEAKEGGPQGHGR